MPENDDLFFFGRIGASVSHELKNVLAVINEQAGLFDDLARRAARGLPLDPDRLALASTCLLKQVRRGDAILNNLSRFAHTADVPRRKVSLAQTANLVVALSQWQATTGQISLEVVAESDIHIATDPFVLCRLLMLCLDGAMAAPDVAKRLTVIVEQTDDGPSLAVTGLDPTAAPVEDGPEQVLAARLGARLVRQPGRIAVVCPPASRSDLA
jgi:signal transduction histidine kinase